MTPNKAPDELDEAVDEILFMMFLALGGVGENQKPVVDKAKAKFHRLIAEREKTLLHKVGDALAWHIARGDIDMVNINLEQVMAALERGEADE